MGSLSQQFETSQLRLQDTSRELTRIAQLPTAQELLSRAKSSFQIDLKIARKAISRRDVGLLTNKRQREFFRKLNEGRSDTAIIKEVEFNLKQSLSAVDRQIVLDLSKGITPTEVALKVSLPKVIRELPFTEIALQQSLPKEFRELSITQIPTQLEVKLQQSLPPGVKEIRFTPQERGQIRSFITKTKEDVKIDEKKFINFLKGKGLTDANIKSATDEIFKPREEIRLPRGPISKRVPAVEKFKVGLEEKFFKPFSDITRGVTIGAIKGPRDEPVKAGVTLASFLVLPGVFRGLVFLGKATKITPILSKLTPASVKSFGRIALTKGLLGAYLVGSGLQIVSEPTAFGKGELAGRKTTTEVFPFVVGSSLGVRGDLKLQIRQEFNKELKKIPFDKREAFKEYFRQSKILGKLTPDVSRNVRFDQVEDLPNNAIPTIRKYFKDNDIAIGGTLAQTAQIRPGRKPGDIDAYTPTGLNPNKAAKDLANQLTQKGILRVSVSPSKPSVLTIGGKKVIDFNNIERLNQNIGSVTPFLVPVDRYIVRTPEGIKVQTLVPQLRRKIVAAFADPKRAARTANKDFKDFKKITDTLIKNAELNARRSFFFKEKRIIALEKEFGVKIPREALLTKKIIKPISVIKKPTKVAKPKEVGVTGITPPKKVDISKPPKFRESPLIRADKIKASQKPFTPSQFKKVVPLIKPSQLPIQPKKKVPVVPSQPFAKKEKIKPGLPFTPVKSVFTPSQPPSQPPKAFKPPIPPIILPPKERERKRKAAKQKLKALLFGKVKKIRRLVPKPKKQPGYFALVKPLRIKVRGKKPPQKRLIKVNKKPATKQRAKDALFWTLDQSLATTGRIVKSKKSAQRLRGFPRGYAQATRNKFREFKIRKGKKIFTPNRFIEIKGRPRLDTLRERKRISALSLIAQQRKKGLKRLKPIKFKRV